MERFRVEVGSAHGAEVENLVGAIANEADIRAEFIGRVDMRDDHSIIELPEGMPKFMLKELRRVWVAGRQLGMSRVTGDGSARVPAAADEAKSNSPTTPKSAPKSAPKSSQKPGPKSTPKSAPKSKKARKAEGHRKGKRVRPKETGSD